MRRTRQPAFWLVCAVLAIGQSCFGQVLDGPDSRQEQIDRYTTLFNDGRWAEAQETLQALSPSNNIKYINDHVRLRILTGNYDEAIRLVESNEPAIKHSPRFID